MMARLAEIGIIFLVIAWSMGVAASAAETTLPTTGTSTEIVITDDVQPYVGPLGPDSPLFELKLALENLDEAFTANASEKVMKEMQHAELRISEIKGLLFMNRSVEAERGFQAYSEKMNLTAVELSGIPVRTTGIANAYQKHVKHELVLWDLLQEHPDSAQLWGAYNSSLALETQFQEKSTIRIEKRLTQLNRITARLVRVENENEPAGKIRGSDTTTPVPTTTDHGKGKEKVGKDQGSAPVTQTTSPSPDNGSGQTKGNGKNGKGSK
ncbi:MAG TPA: DUF5667 domain-containing protein [Methanomicrobiales archaeon]|nr:DUF5667 domain-containing protein [Methanomicrobiales archaeon]